MVSRILAIVVAVGLIVGALAYRNRDDDKSKDIAGDDGRISLVCASELADVCANLDFDELDLSIEPAAATYERLQTPAGESVGEIDVWLVPGPFPTMVDEARSRAAKPPIVGETATVGGARIGVTMWKDRAAVIQRNCGGTEITWRCIGDVTGRGEWAASGGRAEWGLMKLGIADPSAEAAGTLALGAATAGFFGSTAISSVDLNENDQFRAWLGGLAREARQGADLGLMLSQGPSALDCFVGLEPTMAPLVREAARGRDVSVIYPAPVAATAVNLVALGKDRKLTDDLRERITDRLDDAGWKGKAGGLPSAGLLDALRSSWKEASR